jgi:hypothetical protein
MDNYTQNVNIFTQDTDICDFLSNYSLLIGEGKGKRQLTNRKYHSSRLGILDYMSVYLVGIKEIHDTLHKCSGYHIRRLPKLCY